MRLNLPKSGRYVIAVSGGVDSVVLLDLLANTKRYELIVAHFDHGIRTDSGSDRRLTETLADQYHCKFIYEEGRLGAKSSEALCREARYNFLNRVVQETGSSALITAHHLDDRIETMIINLLRGTGRKGMSSLRETISVKRPLLGTEKQELIAYAHQHNLSWREDSTNADERYLRNIIRKRLQDKLSAADKQRLAAIIDDQEKINARLDQLILELIGGNQEGRLKRAIINSLPYNESKELIATWLRANNLLNFDHKTIERLTLAAKTKRPGVKMDIYKRTQMVITKEFLALKVNER
jgi:tRNA(Ile)-lysidine synthetase-like protein